MANLIDEFIGLTETLNRKGIDYAVCGGWAMAIHGLPRATIDIDLLILADDLAEVWGAAIEKGYEVEGLPLHFADGAIEIRRISKIDKLSKTFHLRLFVGHQSFGRSLGKAGIGRLGRRRDVGCFERRIDSHEIDQRPGTGFTRHKETQRGG